MTDIRYHHNLAMFRCRGERRALRRKPADRVTGHPLTQVCGQPGRVGRHGQARHRDRLGDGGRGDFEHGRRLATQSPQHGIALRRVLDVLSREAPGVAVLAEEGGGTRSANMWAVDPLDGTTNFRRGFPSVAVSVGLLEGGRPVAGAVLAPFLDLEFTCARGSGAFMNGRRLPHLRPVAPAQAVVATGFPLRDRRVLDRYERVVLGAIRRFEDLRRAGAAALDLAWVACGRVDAFWEFGLKPWDVAAGSLLVEEAGGHVSNMDGTTLDIGAAQILASNGRLHQYMIEAFAAIRPEAERRHAEMLREAQSSRSTDHS